MCIVVFTLDARLLARSQNSEGPESDHLDTGFSWFPCVYKPNAEMVPKIPSCHYMLLMRRKDALKARSNVILHVGACEIDLNTRVIAIR